MQTEIHLTIAGASAKADCNSSYTSIDLSERPTSSRLDDKVIVFVDREHALELARAAVEAFNYLDVGEKNLRLVFVA